MAFILIFFSQCHTIIQPDEYYFNLLAGEPTQTSVILLARLHKSDTLVNNDLKGIEGYIKFRITRDTEAKNFMESPFFHASDNNDYIAKYEFTGLRPGQKYFYSISYGRDTSNNISSPWNSFKTLNLPSSDKNISFVVANGLNYQAFRNGSVAENVQAATVADLKSGFPGFHAISACKPDFCIENGDDVYYDKPEKSNATTQKDIRIQWHCLFSMSEFNKMLSHIPSFWTLPGDSPAGKVYAEQVPLPSVITEPQSSRTYRLNRDVQIWVLGGPFYMTNPENKNYWGMVQHNWLKNTLKESNAPFKLLISPVSLIGSVDASNIENQTLTERFMTGRDSLFNWLINNGFRNNGLYFICCEPHRQYHSIDPSGFEEFSCGALVDATARISMVPGDSLSTEPAGKIVWPYTQKEAKGGFLMINSNRDEFNSPVLLFRFFDDQKKLLYAVNKY